MNTAQEKTWTIHNLINVTAKYFKGKGVGTPRLDAELLLSKATELSRIELYTNFDREVRPAELKYFREMVRQRSELKPVKYITGDTEFHSLKFYVNEDVLLPRPETEMVVDAALGFIEPAESPKKIIDLCTGSGCIAITIAAKFSSCEVWASDISPEALTVANKNAALHNAAERIRFFEGDMFDAFGDELQDNFADLILSNPPYVPSAELETLSPEVKDYGPRIALDGGAEGLDFYRKILPIAPSKLKKSGRLILEIGDGQSEAIADMAESTGHLKVVERIEDYQNIVRVLIIDKK